MESVPGFIVGKKEVTPTFHGQYSSSLGFGSRQLLKIGNRVVSLIDWLALLERSILHLLGGRLLRNVGDAATTVY